MISFDSHILFAALESTATHHEKARAFINVHAVRDDVVVCEPVLTEVYTLLRNPKICSNPLNARDAVAVIQSLRKNPSWRVVDYVHELADEVWRFVAHDSFAYKRIYDLRIALTLRRHGVQEFATRNAKDFQGLGFKRVWDPLG